MNAVPTDEELLQAPVEGPGKELKSARQAQGLDLPRVASMLHLSQGMLEALEADDYEALPGSVFIQGYLRKYAKLLNVPVEPILEAFDAIRPDKDDKPSLHVHQVRKELRSHHTVVRLMTRLIVVGVIALSLTWWYGYLELPASFSSLGEMFSDRETNDRDVTTIQLTPEQGESQSLPLLLDANSDNSPSTEQSVPAGEAATVEAEPEIEQVIAIAEEVTPKPLLQEAETASEVAATEPALNEEELAPETAAEEVLSDQVELVFSEESWVEIRDSSGEFKILGVMPKASRKILGGEPPYSLVLGNAQLIEINVGGKSWDFSKYISGNVARFTLDP